MSLFDGIVSCVCYGSLALMKKTFARLIRNPVLVATLLFLAGFAGVLTLSYRDRAEANARQIVYIGGDANLYLHNLDAGTATQLTTSEFGVEDFAIAPEGVAIAYSRYNDNSTTDIWLHDLRSGEDFRLTDCINASCGQPSWRADGELIAFTRTEFEATEIQRIWTVNPTTTETRSLFDDPYITGHSPRYAPAGNRIALFATNPLGILVYDFPTQLREVVQSRQGSPGSFSSDGLTLSYPIMVRGALGATFFTQLETVELLSDTHTAITGAPDTPIEDVAGYWRPGHEGKMAVIRRFLDDRFTEGHQVYMLNLRTGEERPLIVDADYTHGSLKWSGDGQQLLVQRFALTDPNASPEIWLYDMQADDLRRIAEDAIAGDFLP